ncbi:MULTISPECIES: hypothetical protein [Mesorhizobium]|nr:MULTISPECIES: hypothetical protein [Mesorhizobium]
MSDITFQTPRSFDHGLAAVAVFEDQLPDQVRGQTVLRSETFDLMVVNSITPGLIAAHLGLRFRRRMQNMHFCLMWVKHANEGRGTAPGASEHRGSDRGDVARNAYFQSASVFFWNATAPLRRGRTSNPRMMSPNSQNPSNMPAAEVPPVNGSAGLSGGIRGGEVLLARYLDRVYPQARQGVESQGAALQPGWAISGVDFIHAAMPDETDT